MWMYGKLRVRFGVSGESTAVGRAMQCSTHERPSTSASGRYLAASVWQLFPGTAFVRLYLGLCTLKGGFAKGDLGGLPRVGAGVILVSL